MDHLPDPLKDKVTRALACHERGLTTADELTDELARLAAELARGSSGKNAADFGVQIARTHAVPLAFLGLMFKWCQPLPGDLQARIDEALIALARQPWDSFEYEGAKVAAQVAAVRPVPDPVRATVRRTPGGSWSSWVDLYECARESDWQEVERRVRDAASRGCVSYALVAIDLLVEAGHSEQAAVSRVLDLLVLEDLRSRASWGGLSLLAARLAVARLDDQARVWSGAVEDGLLYHYDPAVWSRTGWPQRHGEGCRPGCVADDASLLGGLSFVDLLTGLEDRALARARACDRGSDAQGWSTVADVFLSRWVESRSLPPGERETVLEGLTARHTWLGLLQAQIDSDLAELADLRGDPDLAATRRASAAQALKRPAVSLFFPVGFAFESLLGRLPVVARESRTTVSEVITERAAPETCAD